MIRIDSTVFLPAPLRIGFIVLLVSFVHPSRGY